MADYDFQTAGVGWQELSVLEAKRKLRRGLSPTDQRRLALVPGFRSACAPRASGGLVVALPTGQSMRWAWAG